LSQEAALVKMSSAGLVEGNINYKCTDLVAPGFVFRQSPGAGQIVSSNSQYELTIAAADCPTVPDCMGMSLQEARTEIENAGLIADAPTYECSEAPTDDIIEQSPEPGTLLAAGTTIYLVASSGPCPIVPDCVGDDQATAESKIADAGLRTGNISNECHDTIPEGKIISQDPAAGTIAENNDPVDLVLSSGACAPEAPSVGDIDGDGQVCSKDLNLLLGSMWRFVSWNDPRNIDGDGFITYRDYIIIQRYCTYPGCECR
jgi:serine/threonine-protein kinase